MRIKRDERMSVEEHLEEAKKLYRQAVEEFEIAKEKKDSTYLSDVCAKAVSYTHLRAHETEADLV